jgi:hypothetical protein
VCVLFLKEMLFFPFFYGKPIIEKILECA